MKVPHESFNYPLNFENDYILPTRYYQNVSTGHSIIKSEQLRFIDPVIIGIDGIVDNSNKEDKLEV